MRTFTYKVLLAIIMLFNLQYIKAQSPLYDKNWALQTSLSDEFPGTSLSSMWCKWDMFNASWSYIGGVAPCYSWTNGSTRWDDINVTVDVDPNDASKNVLKLKIDAPTGPAPYTWNGTPLGFPYLPTDA